MVRLFGSKSRRITVLQRHRLEPAVEMIGPAVIAALELVGPPLVERDHHGAAMGALVVQHMQRLVGTANHHDRLAPDLGAKVIARLAYLTFMADIDPGAAEDALEFQFEDRRIVVERTVNGRGLYQ